MTCGKMNLVILATAGLLVVGGCAAKKGPFEDVTARQKAQSTLAQAETPVAVPTPATAPAAPAHEQQPPAAAPVARAESAATAPAPTPTAQPVTMIPVVNQGSGLYQRPWTVAVNYRPSGDSLTGHTYEFPRPLAADRRPQWQQGLIEPVEFLASVVLLPVRAVINPPWTTTVTSPMNDEDWTPMGPATANPAAPAEAK